MPLSSEQLQGQQRTLDEFVVIFLVVFLLVNFVPSEQDREMFRAWYIMFCVVRLMFTFILILPQKTRAEEEWIPLETARVYEWI